MFIHVDQFQKELNMPKLCTFLGISIYMYFDEHNPPHFHAEYGLVMEWADLHIKELLDNWDILKETGKCRKIKPLV